MFDKEKALEQARTKLAQQEKILEQTRSEIAHLETLPAAQVSAALKAIRAKRDRQKNAITATQELIAAYGAPDPAQTDLLEPKAPETPPSAPKKTAR